MAIQLVRLLEESREVLVPLLAAVVGAITRYLLERLWPPRRPDLR
jgi:hypothetical protein